MSLVTKQFERLADATARGKGLPDVRRIILPFPYDQLDEAEIRRIARERLSSVVEGLLHEAPSPEGKGGGDA